MRQKRNPTYHSKSLYMMVKKTCKKRLTAFMSTARRYSHASPDIMCGFIYYSISVCEVLACVVFGEVGSLSLTVCLSDKLGRRGFRRAGSVFFGCPSLYL